MSMQNQFQSLMLQKKRWASTLFIVTMMMVWTPFTAKACIFNCSKTPELRASGFVSKSTAASPFANSYKGERPAITLSDPQSAKVIIWLHGQQNPRKKEQCSKQGNLPPKSILTLDEDENTFVYYHCTAVIDPKEEDANQPDDGIHYSWGFKNGSYTLARRDELAELLDQFIGLGVSPSHITLAGHSAGGWTALLAAASYPEKFNAVIAFAPAFAGIRSEEKLYPWWRKIIRPEQVKMITQPNDIQKLIFAYEDDAYNRPQELAFITEAFPDTATLIPQKCGGGHLTHKNDCQMEQTIELMKELISTP